MAERVRLGAYLFICTLVSGLIFPLGVLLTWGGGWLSQLSPPFHDFAGSGVVHMVGGLCGLAGSAIIGARAGRWDPESASDFRPHNVISVLSGVLLLWVGWYGFNAGSTGAMSTYSDSLVASRAAITTTLAGAAGGTTAISLTTVTAANQGKVDILSLGNGILAGLVSITAGCDSVSAPGSLVIGTIGGLVFVLACGLLDRVQVDDVVSAFPVHGACGAWGVLAVGLFHMDDGLFTTGRAELLRSQAIGIGLLAVMSVLPMVILTVLLRYMGILRISAEEEEVGLDAMFGLNAYENHADFVARHHIISEMLTQAGCRQTQLVDALCSLHDNIFRPLSPHAGDHRLDGEVADILDHLKYAPLTATQAGDGGLPTVKPKRHLMFLSHYKSTGGEAVRIFIDRARYLLLQTKHGEREDRAAALSAISSTDLIYLDSVNLKDLSGLLDEVDASINLVLFLTRNCLGRPWVLAELCKAYTSNVNIVLVRVETSADKTFVFPNDVDKAIKEWSWFARPKMQTISKTIGGLMSIFKSASGARSIESATTHDQNMPKSTASKPDRKDGQKDAIISAWIKDGEWSESKDLPPHQVKARPPPGFVVV